MLEHTLRVFAVLISRVTLNLPLRPTFHGALFSRHACLPDVKLAVPLINYRADKIFAKNFSSRVVATRNDGEDASEKWRSFWNIDALARFNSWLIYCSTSRTLNFGIFHRNKYLIKMELSVLNLTLKFLIKIKNTQWYLSERRYSLIKKKYWIKMEQNWMKKIQNKIKCSKFSWSICGRLWRNDFNRGLIASYFNYYCFNNHYCNTVIL